MKTLSILIALLALTSCGPETLCKETLRGDFVCVMYGEATLVQIQPGVRADRYQDLTARFQNLMFEHYAKGGTDAEAAQAIEDLINFE